MTIRSLLTTSSLVLALAAPATLEAAPSRAGTDKAGTDKAGTDKAGTDGSEEVGAALKQWASGDWVSVRSLLEPLISGGRTLSDPLLAETALRYLADATLLDESLDPQIRTQLAMSYISRLFNADPDWRPPPDTHGKPLYDLYNQFREQYERTKLDECLAERASCNADLDDLDVRHARLKGDHESLQRAFGHQEVEVREKVARNRAIALIPFGIGHFYNGRKGLGAAFLAAEAVTGGVGLGLLLYRSTQCTRTAGFSRGSLDCNAPDRDALVLRRNFEQGLGITFISVMALDIIFAQVTFQQYVTVKTERIKREDLEADQAEDALPARVPRKPRESASRRRDNLQARPYPAIFPGGGGAGLTLRF